MRRALASPHRALLHSGLSRPPPRHGGSEFPVAYRPAPVEADWYDWWYHNNYFYSRLGRESFSMILPPPNVTGNLHLGHALTVTIQDVLARRERMGGRSVVWLPGTDHAGIATQAVVEKILLKREGKTRHQVGRDEFLRRVWKWKEEKADYIGEQLRHLGATLDWQRAFFTMDQAQSEAVTEAFLRLWEGGLIYRKEGLVNWSCHLRSAISDIEVDHIPINGPTLISVPGYDAPLTFGQMMYFCYKSLDLDDEVVVATTRLETMLGDVAVAVHPQDQRYKHLWGTRLLHPFTKEAIPIVIDDKIDPSMATGAVKVTPAHNLLDYEIALTHNLPLKVIFNPDGTLTDSCGKFAGLKRFDAREALQVALEELDQFRGVKDHIMQVPICSRSGDVVELFPKPQWYVSCKGMAERASDALKSGALVIEPINYHKEWFEWLENIRDWCVSRQLWWGHRIPMYWCTGDKKSVWVGAKSEEEAKAKGAQLLSSSTSPLTIERDTDVLDTWFSSSLLPFSSLGWPSRSIDLNKYYPLSMMVTGHDILFFWVARMVMMSLQLTDKLPFKKVLLHGVMCDAMGRKMSKSLGNVVNPEDVRLGISLDALRKYVEENANQGVIPKGEVDKAKEGLRELFPQGIPECGVDALRFTLLSHNIKSRYINFNVRECNSNRLFCNKIWQATRFACDWSSKLNLKPPSYELPSQVKFPMSNWILSKASTCVRDVNEAFKGNNFHLATSAIRWFLYSNLCDIYLESIKHALNLGGEEGRESLLVLLNCLELGLRLLSPIMPYLTEELYFRLPGTKYESITIAPFPSNFEWNCREVEEEMETVIEVVSAIRRLRNNYWLDKSSKPSIILVGNMELTTKYRFVIQGLGKCGSIDVVEEEEEEVFDPPLSVSESVAGINVILTLLEEEEGAMVMQGASPPDAKKLAKMEKELEKLLKMVQHEGYSKAPPHVQQAHSEKISKLKAEIEKSKTPNFAPVE